MLKSSEDRIHVLERQWVAFFSQSGSEIYQVSRNVGRFPDVIVTNQQDITRVNSELLSYVRNNPNTIKLLWLPRKPTLENYRESIPVGALVTLHGYLRILPPEICDEYEIYNGHPGLITRYPELKGLDPQVRAFGGRYPRIGCVIHEVTPGVDEGKVIMDDSIAADSRWVLSQHFAYLHILSVNLWSNFLKHKLYIANIDIPETSF